jgi:integrase/recombinase XerD
MNWIRKQGVIQESPAIDLQLPKEEKRLPRHALSTDEVESILEQPDITTPYGLRMRALLELLYSTGLRRREALNLELTDIDRHRRVILVRNGKGNKDRFVPVGDRALAWIDKYLQDARPKFTDDPTQGLLFLTNQGGPIHPNLLSCQVRRMMDRAGITKKGSCHLFRHTAASIMLDNGASIRHLQEILGHENLNSTQVYTHVSIGKLCEVHARTHPARLFRSLPKRSALSTFISLAWQRLRSSLRKVHLWPVPQAAARA